MAPARMLPPTHDDHCRLLGLPEELLAYIVEELLHPRDMPSLRATCKTFERLTTEEFAHCYFFDRSFILSDKNSLGALEHLTEREELAESFFKIRFTNGTADTRDRCPKEEKEMEPERLQRMKWSSRRSGSQKGSFEAVKISSAS